MVRQLGRLVGRQQEVLDAIRRSVAERGRMPTEKEIIFEIKIARGSLTRIIPRLHAKGYLRPSSPLGMLRYELTS